VAGACARDGTARVVRDRRHDRVPRLGLLHDHEAVRDKPMEEDKVESIRFDGRSAIVTGAGNGLGRAHALELSRRGAMVVVNDLGVTVAGTGESQAAADRVVAEIRALGGTAVASYDDVSTPAGGRAIVETAIEAFGRVDVLISNAGILRTSPFTRLSEEDLHAVLGTHLLGSFYVSQPAFSQMLEQGYGRVVFTSSGAGLFGGRHQAAYAAAKCGVVGLASALAIEGRERNVCVNTIAPTAVTRIASGLQEADVTAEDLAHMTAGRAELELPTDPAFVTPLAVYLASERSTGTQRIFSASGGRFARVLTGVTRGWYGPSAAPATPEDVAEHWVEIENQEQMAVPGSVFEEFRFIREWHPG
jgi:NAD(P)-dependent dehydrogenase (short-subunit alcohol dehydrogenase family)